MQLRQLGSNKTEVEFTDGTSGLQPLVDMLGRSDTPEVLCLEVVTLWRLQCYWCLVAEEYSGAVGEFYLCFVTA